MKGTASGQSLLSYYFQTGVQPLADLLIGFIQIPPNSIEPACVSILHLLQTHDHDLNRIHAIGKMSNRFLQII